MNGRTNVISSGNDSLGGIIPLEAPNTFVVVADNAKCLLSWTDPKDKYADELGEITDEGDQLVSQFAFTRIVRKEGSAPGTPNDGVIVTESSTRNQYQSTQYIDEGLTNNVEYFYAAFTCNTDGVWSGSSDIQTATPKAYDPILAKNTWEQINEVANEGFADSVWEIGDEIDINADSQVITMIILGFNVMDKSDGSGKAPITFASKNLTNKTFMSYDLDLKANYANDFYDGSIGIYITDTIYNSLDESIKSVIPLVKSWSEIGTQSYSQSYPTFKSIEKDLRAFAFPVHEIKGKNYSGSYSFTYPSEGYDQWSYFSTAINTIKYLNNGSGEKSEWMTSTCWYDSSRSIACCINTGGSVTNFGNNSSFGICFGFCVGTSVI